MASTNNGIKRTAARPPAERGADPVLAASGPRDDRTGPCFAEAPAVAATAIPGSERQEVQECIASLHLGPGEDPPNWWEECEACHGPGCDFCDGSGRMHPKRAEWLEDGLNDAQLNFNLFHHVLREPMDGTALGAEATLALGEVAAEFSGRFAATGAIFPEDHDEVVKANARRAVGWLAGNLDAARGKGG